MSASSTRPSRTRAASGVEERVAGRQLDVDAGGEGQRGRLAEVGGDGVHGVQERHGEVVGDDGAVEAPPIAQDAR